MTSRPAKRRMGVIGGNPPLGARCQQAAGAQIVRVNPLPWDKETELMAHRPATVAALLRLGAGFAAAERPDLLESLASLDGGLAGFAVETVELELSIRDRDRVGQTATLQCWIRGSPSLIATSSRQSLSVALVEVRDHLGRQLEDTTRRNLLPD